MMNKKLLTKSFLTLLVLSSLGGAALAMNYESNQIKSNYMLDSVTLSYNENTPTVNENSSVITMKNKGMNQMAVLIEQKEFETMSQLMENTSVDDYEKMIQAMKDNGFVEMANIMEAMDKDNRVQMHNAMSNSNNKHCFQ